MKRSEIIEINNEGMQCISYEELQPYLKSLYIYYKDKFTCEPVLMVTSVFNAATYCRIVSSDNFEEIATEYAADNLDIEDYEHEDVINEVELINFNSKMLRELAYPEDMPEVMDNIYKNRI